MGYFPMFIEMEGRSVLCVGGGAVAARRVLKLLSLGARVTLVAPKLHPSLEGQPGSQGKGRLTVLKMEYEQLRTSFYQGDWRETGEEADVLLSLFFQGNRGGAPPFFMALIATGNQETDRLAEQDARKAGAFVNTAGDRRRADFYFPGTAGRGRLTAGVIAGGENHWLAKRAAEEIGHLFAEQAGKWEAESRQREREAESRQREREAESGQREWETESRQREQREKWDGENGS